MSKGDPAPHLVATEAAQQAIIRLQAVHGPPDVRPVGWMLRRQRAHVLPGRRVHHRPVRRACRRVTGCPFYMDERQYAAWHTDQLILDIDPGMAEGFSLPADGGWHFVTRSVLCIRDDDPVRDFRNGAAPRPGPA